MSIMNKYEHPHDELNVKDNTFVTETTIQNDGPILFQPIVSTKGEDSVIKTWYNLDSYIAEYGDPNLDITGQGAYNAKLWLESGGVVKAIRLTAKNARRANSVVMLKLKIVEQQATTEEGEPLYIDSVTGAETVISTGNAPSMYQVAKVKLVSGALDNIPINNKDAESMLCGLYQKNDATKEYTIPLFAFISKGKGTYGDQFRYRLTVNSTRDKYTDFRNYHVQIFKNESGGLKEVENSPVSISLDPNATYNKKTQYGPDIINGLDFPIKMITVPKYFTEASQLLLPILKQGDPDLVLDNIDLLLFCDEKLNSYKFVEFDPESINISALEGFGLKKGSDGDFALDNIESREKAINERYLDLFEGLIDSSILDKKQHKIDLAIDSNLSLEVKNSMRLWSLRRGDGKKQADVPIIFDAGICYTKANVLEFLSEDTEYNCSDFTVVTQNFDTRDPITGKIIKVTAAYLYAALLCKHIINPLMGNHIPFAGIDIKLDDYIIEGSLAPIYSTDDDKNEIYKARGNYIEKEIGGHYIFGSNVTTQLVDSEMSYFNNTLVCHEIINDIITLGNEFRFKEISTTQDVAKLNKLGNDKLSKYVGTKILAGSFDAAKDAADQRGKTLRSKIALGFKSYLLDNIFDVEIERQE